MFVKNKCLHQANVHITILDNFIEFVFVAAYHISIRNKPIPTQPEKKKKKRKTCAPKFDSMSDDNTNKAKEEAMLYIMCV